MNKKGILFVISGPSGAGKGTLVSRLLQSLDSASLYFSVSCATRAPRKGEIDGVHYHFIGKDEFDRFVSEDRFLEYNHYCKGDYGTLAAPVLEALEQGKSSILEIDCNGMRQVREKCPDAVTVFISPPSLAELEKRLRSRGTETEEQIQKRIAAAEAEMAFSGEYDHIVVNDDLDRAALELSQIFKKYMN